ncbi:MAG TPA: OsmC family protein [Gammaproteobacteria bacterium]|nr:OsmC family protein [Gammaproteobacteria bacterium]
MAEHKEHHYTVTCRWNGSTAQGYEVYSRAHDMAAPPAKAALTLSSDPAFRGDPALLNPEQLLVMAASSCQFLSFLAVAARKRIDVVEYEDQAEGFMPEDDKPVRITRIVLRPHIVVKGAADESAVLKAVETGHEHCFIANSIKSDVRIEPKIVIRP